MTASDNNPTDKDNASICIQTVTTVPDVDSVNPWTTLSNEVRYDNPWISVEHHEVLNPAGNPGIYGKVHFKNKAIAVLPLDAQYNTWLVGQYRFTLQHYSWEIPEGGGALEDDPLDAAKRELLEETGITAKTWTPLLRLHLSNSVSDEEAFGFVARDLKFGEAQPEETEELALVKVPFNTALQYALNGQITDALAVSCLLKAARMIEKGEL